MLLGPLMEFQSLQFLIVKHLILVIDGGVKPTEANIKTINTPLIPINEI